ncbi:hypothetical protein [Streptomyces sp. BP-8]|uniref:LLM class flavin-dependent oxidoreductase n=1 Tax=Streptomyces sirii TaxID=3127701 RepID=A0ABZ2R095_9ACTN
MFTGQRALWSSVFGPIEEQALDVPTLLIGTPRQMAEQLRERRERFGFSYITVLDPFLEAFAPVLEELAGS